MKNSEKFKLVFSLAIDIADAVVTINDIWQRIKPEVKPIIEPIIGSCKKLVDSNKIIEIE